MEYDYPMPTLSKLDNKKVVFLLGTDKYIGKEGAWETRVGVTPDQVSYIRNYLIDLGIELDFYFIKGAGENAGFNDTEYIAVGGKMVQEDKLNNLIKPDIFHALKEPADYEVNVPKKFIRIGALHSGVFTPKGGLAKVIIERNFSGIFDGSHTGEDGFTPIRIPMSIYAGEIAAEDCYEHFQREHINNPKVVIHGCGFAGKAALKRLLNLNSQLYSEIIVVEHNEQKVTSLIKEFRDATNVKFIVNSILNRSTINNANAVILTAFTNGEEAPNAVELNELEVLSDNSIIVDISIDEGGSINLPEFDRFNEDDLNVVIEKFNSEISRLNKGIKYMADNHMPRRKPREASIAHGKGVSPFIIMLLYYVAKIGSVENTIKFILTNGNSNEKHLSHLKNGLAVYSSDDKIVYNANVFKNTVKHNNKTKLETFLKDREIQFDSFQ